MFATVVRAAYFAVLAAVTMPAIADMTSASDTLARGNPAGAFKEYETLARLGNATAQFNVGTMLLIGQGVPHDLVSGAGWLMAAKENTPSKSLPQTDAVLDALSEEEESAARKLATEHQREAAALQPKPLPELVETDADHLSKLRDQHIDESMFHIKRSAHIGLAWLMVRVVVDADGQAVDVWTPESSQSTDLSEGLLAFARKLQFTAASRGGMPVPSSFEFRLKNGTEWITTQNPELKAYLERMRAAATQGDNAARYRLARLSTSFSELTPAMLDRDQVRAWMIDLAKVPEEGRAMYFLPETLGVKSLTPAEILQWKVRSAQAGFPPAQLDIALMCWAERGPDSMERARRWLEPASASGFAAASRYLAALLLEQGDAKRPLELVQALLENPLYKGDPDTWQLVAAAYAAQGNFAEATAHEARAISFLSRKSPRVARFTAHLTALKSNTAIKDELLTIPAVGYY